MLTKSEIARHDIVPDLSPMPAALSTRSPLETDLVWHEGRHPLESWHFAANLRGDGKQYSFRVHLVIVDSAEEGAQVSIGMCLLDQDTGWIREVENTVPLQDIVISSNALKITTRVLDITGYGNEIYLTADLPDVYVELTSRVDTPILINNGEGSFSFLGAQQHKFAFPALNVSGSVTLMGKTQTVTGAMWLNRQWGELPNRFSLDRNLEHRQWINLYPLLSNGIRLSASQLWDFTKDCVESSCTVLLPDGTHIVEKIEPLQLSDFMESRLSGRRYPRHVVLTHEPLETNLHISLPYKEREVVSKVGNLIKFDGKIVVDGYIYGEEVTGDGFVEMVGRWR